MKNDRRHHFRNVMTNPFWRLVDIIPQLGVSKQRVTQLFKEYFGINYLMYNQIKQQSLRRELACWDTPRHPVHFLSIFPESSHWHRHFKAEVKFIERLERHGLSWNYEQESPLRTRFRINGHLIAVRASGCAKLVCPCGPKYYKYVGSYHSVDFLACYRQDIDLFYIVPKSNGHVYIRSTESDKPWAGANYKQYLEAWRLLEKRNGENMGHTVDKVLLL